MDDVSEGGTPIEIIERTVGSEESQESLPKYEGFFFRPSSVPDSYLSLSTCLLQGTGHYILLSHTLVSFSPHTAAPI